VAPHESRSILDPSFSPQGDRILFFGATAEGDIHEFIINTDGSSLTQVTHGKGERDIHSKWSSDGSTVYFYQIQPTTSFRKISIGEAESSELVSGWLWGTQFGARVDAQGQSFMPDMMGGSVVATMIRDTRPAAKNVFTSSLTSRTGRATAVRPRS
jgi:Tol biopolymer transport system component